MVISPNSGISINYHQKKKTKKKWVETMKSSMADHVWEEKHSHQTLWNENLLDLEEH